MAVGDERPHRKGHGEAKRFAIRRLGRLKARVAGVGDDVPEKTLSIRLLTALLSLLSEVERPTGQVEGGLGPSDHEVCSTEPSEAQRVVGLKPH